VNNAHWLKANRTQLEGLGNGATFKEISKSIIAKVEIPLPSLVEQQKIARILDCAEMLRARRRESIALLDKLGQSVFIDMFGSLIIDKRDTGLIELSSVAEIQTGPFGSLLHQEDYIIDGIPLINPMHITRGRIEVDRKHSVKPSKASSLTSYRLRPGDIIMGRRGEMGRCAVVGPEHAGFLCGTGSLIIRPNKNLISATYLKAFLTHPSMKRHLENVSLGTTMSNLNQKIVGGLNIKLPSMSHQLEFESRLATIEQQESFYQAQLGKLDALFASLQHRAFRGEL
jgi:type I restriction enzyme S subunit